MATLAERLNNIQTAIAKIEDGGQRVSVDGVWVERPDLEKLYAEQERLERRIARETNRRRSVAEF